MYIDSCVKGHGNGMEKHSLNTFFSTLNTLSPPVLLCEATASLNNLRYGISSLRHRSRLLESQGKELRGECGDSQRIQTQTTPHHTTYLLRTSRHRFHNVTSRA